MNTTQNERLAAVLALVDQLQRDEGLSQEQVGKKVGVSGAILSQLRSGKYNGDIENQIKKLEDFCGLEGGASCNGSAPNSGRCRCTADISVQFDKSVLIDEAAERENDRQDVRDGTLSKWEYRMKYRGETEEEAKKAIEEISGSDELYGGDLE